MGKRILQGAALALFVTAFRLMLGSENAAMRRVDLTILTIAVAIGGGAGGAAWYALDALRVRGPGQRILANVLSLLAYVVATVGVLAAGVYWLRRG